MEERALYVPDGDGFVGTILTQGGWHPEEANGGTVLALLGHCLEDVPTLVPMLVSRFTADLMRPIPLGRRLHVRSEVLREGKKIQLVELRLEVDEVVHVRATALRLRAADVSDLDLPPSTTDARPAERLIPPEQAPRPGIPGYELPGFLHAVDFRRATTVDGTGSGSWVRLDVPVVAGEAVRDTSRLTFCLDFTTLVGVTEHKPTITMINPDVSAHLLRPPTGEWVAITGDTRFNPALGRGLSSAVLSDELGPFAVASVSQLLQPR